MLHFKLVTLRGVSYDKDVYEVILPTLDGQIGVLPGHMPLISVAGTGVISVRESAKDPDYKMSHFAVFGGVVEVDNDNLKVLVDEADNGDEINEAEAQRAFERALKMKQEAKDQTSLEQAQAIVDRQTVRLHLAELKRHRR